MQVSQTYHAMQTTSIVEESLVLVHPHLSHANIVAVHQLIYRCGEIGQLRVDGKPVEFTIDVAHVRAWYRFHRSPAAIRGVEMD